ncbi:MAG: heme exporter protein CcmB [Acidobacteriota bacterium]
MRFLKVVAIVFLKDFQEELRRKEDVAASSLFALLSLVLFAFALDPTRVDLNETGSGLLWLVVLFAGSLFMGGSFRKETENGTLFALLLSPCDRGALYVGKFLLNFVFLLALEALLLLFAFLLLDFRVLNGLSALALVWVLVTFGYAAVGTLFSALLAQVRGGHVIFPILLFPILVPLVIAAATLTEQALSPGFSWGNQWLRLVGLFDILFFTASVFLFEFAVEE